MKKYLMKKVIRYVEDNIGIFHQKRIASIEELKLSQVLKRKNPYLFKAKYILTAEKIVKTLVDAHISSNEETIFGDWLEGLAIFINKNIYHGWKSGIPGIDLEFNKDGNRYIVNIKSGPNWGNNSQLEKMVLEFGDAKKTLSTSGSKLNVLAINGCCYGRDKKPHKFPKKGGDYFKYCGQEFWEFISGDHNLYIEIIEPLGHKAKERNEDFIKAYSQMINIFTKQFINEFCKANGSIDWEKIVIMNSAATQLKTKR